MIPETGALENNGFGDADTVADNDVGPNDDIWSNLEERSKTISIGK